MGAKFRKAKGGIKTHTLFDITTQIPAFIHITSASVNDMNAMDHIIYEESAYYIFDRGYVDFSRLYTITQRMAYFVIRAKSSLKYRRIYSAKVDKATEVLCDQTGRLTGYYTAKDYPEKLRRVKYYDKESKRTFVFLTNNMEVTAAQVALLYKNRWQIELLFKGIKQHLKIKSFWDPPKMQFVFNSILHYRLLPRGNRGSRPENRPINLRNVTGNQHIFTG